MSKHGIISHPFLWFLFYKHYKPQHDIVVVGLIPKVYRSDHIYLPYSADKSCDKSLSQSVILDHTCFYVYILYKTDKSISSCAQYMTMPCKNNFHIQVSLYACSQPHP
jgi:hypothetical protein